VDGVASLRYFRNDRGETFAERGSSNSAAATQTPGDRFLAGSVR